MWATYVPGRSPQFKIHVERGHALAACSYHGRFILYKKVDDQWVEHIRQDKPLWEFKKEAKCDGCGNSLDHGYGTLIRWYDTDVDPKFHVYATYNCEPK